MLAQPVLRRQAAALAFLLGYPLFASQKGAPFCAVAQKEGCSHLAADRLS
jgi:hypothetical protein